MIKVECEFGIFTLTDRVLVTDSPEVRDAYLYALGIDYRPDEGPPDYALFMKMKPFFKVADVLAEEYEIRDDVAY